MATICGDWEASDCGNKICCYECTSRKECNIACGKINDITEEDVKNETCEYISHI